MTVFIPIPDLNPSIILQTAIRPLAGPINTGDIVKSDTDFYGSNIYARWLYVGVTGNITYVKWDGTTQLLKNLAAGVWHPIYSIRVNSTGTTATDMVWGN